ncbi:MAG: DUF5688 family protein [Clostridiales bacterium]|jgi:hypothetical protein|nr:DUF5688 family protein [Clostridiales bacterium]
MEELVTYKQFIDKLRNGLGTVFGEEFSTDLMKVNKSDDYVLDAVVISKNYPDDADAPDSPHTVEALSVNLYTEELYAEYKAGAAFGDIMFRAVSSVENSFGLADWTKAVVKNLFSFEKIKAQLIIRGISYDGNKLLLTRHVYRRLADIAFVLYAMANDSEHSMASIKVGKELAEGWGVDLEKVQDDALKNTSILFPPRLMAIEHFILHQKDAKKNTYNFMDPHSNFKMMRSLTETYVLTNDHQINGATACFYPGVLEKLARLFRSNFYIVPTSIHEVMLHPAGAFTIDEMRKKAKAQQPLVTPDSFLSHAVFLYNKDKGTLTAKL